MPTWETPFEVFALAEEVTPGTAVTPPTDKLNMRGTITPKKAFYRPTDELGMLAEYSDSEVTRKWGEFEAEGRLDANTIPRVARAAINGAVSAPTTPASAVLARLWTFPRFMTADQLKAWTSYWGDPNNNIIQGPYSRINEFSVSSGEVGGEDGSTMGIAGMCHFPNDIAAPAMPANAFGSLMVPGRIQLWLDTSSVHGTTAVSGRILSVDTNVPVGVTYKFPDVGPAGTDLNYVRTGRVKTHPEMTIRLEFVDYTQYTLWKNAARLKARVRHNGRLIETVAGPLSYYHYVQFDITGNADDIAWGQYQESNRSIEFTILGEYDAALSSDLVLYAQNAKTTL